MNKTKHIVTSERTGDFGTINLTIIAASVGALTATFLLGYVNLGFVAKLLSFALIVVVYLAICASVGARRKTRSKVLAPEDNSFAEAEIESRLRALEEASEYFSAALKPADMFRLVASRANELFPFSSCVLLRRGESEDQLLIEYSDGENARDWKASRTTLKSAAAVSAFDSGQIYFEENFEQGKSYSPPFLSSFSASAAIPLRRGDEIFAVFQLYWRNETQIDDSARQLLEAIGERIAPLMASAMTFETSLSNALTDSLTKLPNQRAFFLVLENQIAESVRHKSERALSVLAIDIVNFDDLNNKFGHATADRILAFVGENIKTQLRQMDFLARSSGDEFLAVLPTAGRAIAAEIIERIEQSFTRKYFGIDESEKVYIRLNFGAATFGGDGETAPQLLRNAIFRKQQSKSNDPGNVLWFPKELVN